MQSFGYTGYMAKIIGVDVGTKRVGLAYGDLKDGFAFPLKVIKVQNISGSIDLLADNIVKEFFDKNKAEHNESVSNVSLYDFEEKKHISPTCTSVSTSTQTSTQISKTMLVNMISDKIIVLGESKNFKGFENPIMVYVHKLKSILEKKGFLVPLVPEFMTSVEASRIQGETNLLDASAATIILQSYLDKVRHHS